MTSLVPSLQERRRFRLANDKAQDVTVKKLVRTNPTMKEKFDQARSLNQSSEAD